MKQGELGGGDNLRFGLGGDTEMQGEEKKKRGRRNIWTQEGLALCMEGAREEKKEDGDMNHWWGETEKKLRNCLGSCMGNTIPQGGGGKGGTGKRGGARRDGGGENEES